jgi:hypothetical protein
MRYRLTVALATAGLASLAPAVMAQGASKLTPANICGLLSKAQVEKETGIKLQTDPEGMPLAFGGATCDYDGNKAQVIFFPGPNAETKWEGMMKEFKQDISKRQPVPGLGSSAYAVLPPPKHQYERLAAMVVVKTGADVVIVSSTVDSKSPHQNALAPTLALAKQALAKLR